MNLFHHKEPLENPGENVELTGTVPGEVENGGETVSEDGEALAQKTGSQVIESINNVAVADKEVLGDGEPEVESRIFDLDGAGSTEASPHHFHLFGRHDKGAEEPAKEDADVIEPVAEDEAESDPPADIEEVEMPDEDEIKLDKIIAGAEDKLANVAIEDLPEEEIAEVVDEPESADTALVAAPIIEVAPAVPATPIVEIAAAQIPDAAEIAIQKERDAHAIEDMELELARTQSLINNPATDRGLFDVHIKKLKKDFTELSTRLNAARGEYKNTYNEQAPFPSAIYENAGEQKAA